MSTTSQVQFVGIYGLADPRDGEIRYVGKAKDPETRLDLHLCETQLRPKTHRNHWLRKLRREGIRPQLFILEQVPDTHWRESERYWIKRFRDGGHKLVNGTEGGEGLHNPTAEVREKIGAARRGKKIGPQPPEHRKKIEEAFKAFYESSPEYRKFISDRMKGNKYCLGRKLSEEHKEKLLAASLARQRALGIEGRHKHAMVMVAARKSRTLECKNCGAVFSSKAHNAMFCGVKCKKDFNNV